MKKVIECNKKYVMDSVVICRVQCSSYITRMIRSRRMELVWRLRVQEAENCVKNVGRETFREKSLV